MRIPGYLRHSRTIQMQTTLDLAPPAPPPKSSSTTVGSWSRRRARLWVWLSFSLSGFIGRWLRVNDLDLYTLWSVEEATLVLLDDLVGPALVVVDEAELRAVCVLAKQITLGIFLTSSPGYPKRADYSLTNTFRYFIAIMLRVLVIQQGCSINSQCASKSCHRVRPRRSHYCPLGPYRLALLVDASVDDPPLNVWITRIEVRLDCYFKCLDIGKLKWGTGFERPLIQFFSFTHAVVSVSPHYATNGSISRPQAPVRRSIG